MTESPNTRIAGDTPDLVRVALGRACGTTPRLAIDVQYTKPGTALDDHLRKEQTRALLDLLADYVQKLDKSGDTRP